ncbi:hypothetical protein GF324_04280 [bacterium]|nr:hypothetical protein [bacterium]
MELTIGWHDFNGPVPYHKIPQKPGLAAVICRVEVGKLELLDIFEGENLRDTVHHHPRQECHKSNCDNDPEYFLYLTDQSSDIRRGIGRDIRQQYEDIPCGE